MHNGCCRLSPHSRHQTYDGQQIALDAQHEHIYDQGIGDGEEILGQCQISVEVVDVVLSVILVDDSC